MITNTAVAEQAQTSYVCPVQIEGTLTDGRRFYFRYRWGFASLGLGATEHEAIDDDSTGARVGDSLDGAFDSDEQMNAVFDRLLAQHRAGTNTPGGTMITDDTADEYNIRPSTTVDEIEDRLWTLMLKRWMDDEASALYEALVKRVQSGQLPARWQQGDAPRQTVRGGGHWQWVAGQYPYWEYAPARHFRVRKGELGWSLKDHSVSTAYVLTATDQYAALDEAEALIKSLA